MQTSHDLERKLASIDRRGYPAYKSLRGRYDFRDFVLSIDHVQGDPFAAPSRVSLMIPAEVAGFPSELSDAPHRRVALEDTLCRRFAAEAARASFKVGGSGKSGLIATSRPGPEVLARSACEVTPAGITMRLEVGFPAHGRTVDARALDTMLFELVPACAERSLLADTGALAAARAAVELADDQHAVRCALERLGLVAFVADGSILPRATGASSQPLAGALPFQAPESLSITLDLPHRGSVRGLAIRRGITLIVGGGYHGKSTLLQALQEGVYNHVAGDGRELAITDSSAFKLRAEDGRPVHATNIAPFIANLPDGRDTRAFTTADASGSTSQAASLVEAVEMSSRVLLIDEDTSATNFMVRDALMEEVVAAEQEPITPFVERVRALWEQAGVSSVIVVGSSGAFFPVADTVVQMDCYRAIDVTQRVDAVLAAHGMASAATAGAEGAVWEPPRPRRLALDLGRGTSSQRGRSRGRSRGASRGHDDRRPAKLKVQGLDGFSVGEHTVDLRQVEQLVEGEQTAALARMVRLVLERGLLDGTRPLPQVVEMVFRAVEERGWQALDETGAPGCGLALPRPLELAVCLNRWR